MASDRDIPRTGPQAILHALQQMDLDAMEAKAREEIKSGKKTKRPKAVAILNAVAGMRKNELSPSDFMVETVPVIPHQFRPYSVMGSTFIPGDANVLYGEVIDARNAHNEEKDILGEENSGPSLLNMYDAVKAVYGYGDPVKEKTRQKEVKGFLSAITGSTSKYGFVNRKLLSKPQDNTGRSTIVVDPELGLDEIGMPTEMAFTVFAPFVQRKLRQMGYGAADSIKHWKDRTDTARKALVRVLEGERGREQGQPAVYTRAPAWHGPSILSGYVKLRDGEALAINPYVTTGLGADFDGDALLSTVYVAINTDTYMSLDQMSQIQLGSIGTWADNMDMFTDLEIPILDSSYIISTVHLEDFPRGNFTNSVDGKNGKIDYFAALPGTKVLAYDESSGKVGWKDASYWSIHYGRRIEVVTLEYNHQIVTDDDPRAVYGIAKDATSLTPERFTPTAALEKNVLVAFAKSLPDMTSGPAKSKLTLTEGQEFDLDFDFGLLLGTMIGDGWWDKKKYQRNARMLYLADSEGYSAAAVERVLRTRFPDLSVYSLEATKEEEGRYGRTKKYTFNLKTHDWFSEAMTVLCGGVGDETTAGSANKHLPACFLRAPREFQEGLLCGLLDTDGSCSVSRSKEGSSQLLIQFSSTSLRLAQEVKLLASVLDIQATLQFSKETIRGNTSWIVNFSTPDMKRANVLSGMANSRKREVFLNTAVSESPEHKKYDSIPFPDIVSSVIRKQLESPKVRKEDRSRATEESKEKIRKQNVYISIAAAAETGKITRFCARRVLEELRSIIEERRQVRDKAIAALKSDCACDEEFIELVRAGIRSVAHKDGDWDLHMLGRKYIARTNRPLREKKMSPESRAEIWQWIESLPVQDPVGASELVAEWKRLYLDNEHVCWLAVVDVEKTGKVEDVYDLTVPGYETFASADGIILSNTINVHAPATPRAIEEARTIMLPSYQPFSNREEGSIVPAPKQEAVLSYYTANKRPAEAVHTFDTEEDALKAIRAGKVPLHDEIEVRGGIKMAGAYDRPSEPPVSTLEEKRPVKDPATGKFMPTVRKLDGGEVQGDSEEHKKE